MANEINSIGVSIVNFMLNDEKKDGGIFGLIADATQAKYKEKGYVTPIQLREAIQYPFSSLKSVLYTELSLHLELEKIYRKQVECLELLDTIKITRLQQQAQALQDLQKEEPPPPPDLSELDTHEQTLADQLQALHATKQQLETAQKTIQPLLKQYREEWQNFHEKAKQETVEGLEKVLSVKLKENEADQLKRIESLESVFTRFKELGIEPPISYAEAEKTPASLLMLTCYLTAKEVINRATIA